MSLGSVRVALGSARMALGAALGVLVVGAFPGVGTAEAEEVFNQVYDLEVYYSPMSKRYSDLGGARVKLEREGRGVIARVKGKARHPTEEKVYFLDLARKYLFQGRKAYAVPMREESPEARRARDLDDPSAGEGGPYRKKMHRILPFFEIVPRILSRKLADPSMVIDGSYYVPVIEGRGNETLDLVWSRRQDGLWQATLIHVGQILAEFFVSTTRRGRPWIEGFHVRFTNEVEFRLKVR